MTEKEKMENEEREKIIKELNEIHEPWILYEILRFTINIMK